MYNIFHVWSNLQGRVKTHATGEDFGKSISVTRNIRRGKEDVGKRKNKQGESGTMCVVQCRMNLGSMMYKVRRYQLRRLFFQKIYSLKNLR